MSKIDSCKLLNQSADVLQIVHESDQIYGVSHSARISTIDAITRQDALDFLNTEEKTAAME